MWCPSCIYFYDEVRQARLPFKVSHDAEFLVSRLSELQFTRRVNVSVALHCHNSTEPRRREGLAGQRLLEAVPGLRYVEIEPGPRFGRSCTPAVQQQVGLDVWNGVAREEIDRACAAGADTLATIYHGCQRYSCVFEPERPIAIEHYLSVFARGLAETTPCQRANNVDAARAREVVRDAFGPLPSARDAAHSPPS